MLATQRIIRTAATQAARGRASMSTLVFADHDNTTIGAATLSAVTAATQLPGDVTVLVAGHEASAAATAAAAVAGVTKVLHLESAGLAKPVAEPLTAALLSVLGGGGYTHVVAGATNVSKNVIPRVAALMDSSPITDIIAIEGADTFVRPMYAGNALATVQATDALKFLTVRGTNFDKAEETGGSAAIETVGAGDAPSVTATFVSEAVSKSDRPDLTAARVVISGGRGMKNGENFTEILEPLADKLGGAVGASRAAVDAGFVPNDYQVGQTGKVVAPELYVACGISGAIQHLSGMKDSKTIVAINKDAEAPIFQVADYGLVGDLFTIVPDLTSKL